MALFDPNNIPPPPVDIPILKPIGQGIDALFNSIVGGFDSVMNWAVQGGGLARGLEALGEKISDFGNTISAGVGGFLPQSPSVPDNTPVQETKVAVAMDLPQSIPDHVVAKVASAGINVQTLAIAHVESTTHHLSTPSQGMDNSIGGIGGVC